MVCTAKVISRGTNQLQRIDRRGVSVCVCGGGGGGGGVRGVQPTTFQCFLFFLEQHHQHETGESLIIHCIDGTFVTVLHDAVLLVL